MRILNCKFCNAEFLAKTKWQMFCGSKCKQRTYRHPCEKCPKLIVPSARWCHKCKPPSRNRDAVFFWSQVKKTESCWIWNGSKYGTGYGRATVNGKRMGAHRHAWELENGSIPEGLYVCHHCDNPTFVRPDHLFIGTCKDNMQDWTSKGFNRLVSDPEYKVFMKKPKGDRMRQLTSERLKEEIRSGKRIVIRDNVTGRINGTEMNPCAY